jgi:hypothetical protein
MVAEITVAINPEGITITKTTELNKCNRCWNYRLFTGEFCDRCQAILSDQIEQQ